MIVVEHWGAPAGFAVVVPRDDGNADLDGPFVEPDLWRGGFGRKLVEEAAHFATILEASLPRHGQHQVGGVLRQVRLQAFGHGEHAGRPGGR